MKKLLLTLLCITCGIIIGLSLNAYAQESTSIPNWIKSTAKFWVNGDVGDNEFEKGIQYLVENKIIKISEAQQNSQSIQRVPHWVKNLAGMWINDTASDDDFTKAIEYLVNVGIIIVNVQSNQTNTQNQTTVSTPVTSTDQTPNSLTLSKPIIPAPKQVPKLPMLMLTSNNNRAYMAFTYNLSVRIFDPQSNPDKIFDQFIGGISDTNITATIVDSNNKIIGQSIGKTDSKGFYQVGIIMPYTQSSQEQVQVIINATKNGYVTQQVTLPLTLIRYNS
jgi:hypothetical protein